jgi:hypothetical protein
MASIQRFEDIKAWQKARELVREVYKACASTRLGRDFIGECVRFPYRWFYLVSPNGRQGEINRSCI